MAIDVAFIGFGEAARAFAATLGPVTGGRFTAYDILLDHPGPGTGPLRAAADLLGVALAPSASDAARDAGIVISAVTAAASLAAVAPLAGRLGPRQVLVDINSVSAGRKAETAALVRGGGAAYVDMAVMAPVQPHGHRTPVLVAGDLAGGAEGALRALDFRHEVVGPEAGQAAAVKMLRSLFVKGLEAVTVQALAAAEAAGCRERVQASLAASFPGLGWPDFAAYQFERVTTHGRRRAEEMREVAATMAELGFAEGAALAGAIADLHAAVGRAGAEQASAASVARSLRGHEAAPKGRRRRA